MHIEERPIVTIHPYENNPRVNDHRSLLCSWRPIRVRKRPHRVAANNLLGFRERAVGHGDLPPRQPDGCPWGIGQQEQESDENPKGRR
jgi:hypothetical protein